MTKDMRDKFYWDSCAFLAYLQDENGADLCELVLDAADHGQLLIVTSALTIAEVLNLRGKVKIGADRRDDVVKLFSQDYIHVRNITRRTGELARDLFWDHDIPAKDALHVAAALEARLPVMNTFDDTLLKRGKALESRLRIEKPFYSHQTELPLEEGEAE